MDAKEVEALKFLDEGNMEEKEKAYNDLWDLIVNNGIATDDELDLIQRINGFRIETLEDILYVRTGYRDAQQYKEDELNAVDYE